MYTTKKLTLLLVLFVTPFCLLFSQDSTYVKKKSPVRLMVKGALELGGDNIAEVYFTNGESQKVRAGQGGSIAVGAQFHFPRVEKLLLHATVGYKYLTTAADNVHIRLTRVPIHLTANWKFSDKFRLGGGIAMHQAIRFKTDGLGEDYAFDAAKGPYFEFAYKSIGLSYTAMKYKDQNKNTYAANAVGLTFTLVIPNK